MASFRLLGAVSTAILIWAARETDLPIFIDLLNTGILISCQTSVRLIQLCQKQTEKPGGEVSGLRRSVDEIARRYDNLPVDSIQIQRLKALMWE